MATSDTADIGQLVVCRPGVKGGRPCLAGTGMMVRTVAELHNFEGLSAEEILEEYPDLDLARIYAALAHYYANKAHIDADLKADMALYDQLADKYPRGWPPRRLNLKECRKSGSEGMAAAVPTS